MSEHGIYRATNLTLADGQQSRLGLTQNGALRVVAEGGGTGTNANQVQGTSASGAADDGSNPVKVGGVYRATQPTLTSGQRADLQVDAIGNQRVTLQFGNTTAVVTASGDNVGGYQGLYTWAQNVVYNPATDQWSRSRGDTTGTWIHNPVSTASSALSGTISASGGTAAIAMTNTTRTEVINPSTGTLWASWGTPAVNGAGSFPINAGGTYSPPDRTAGTLTLLSTAATQPYTVNRFS